MTVYKCDRCNAIVKSQGDLYTMQRISVGDKVPMADITKEICGNCAGQIMRDWNTSLPKEADHADA